MKKKIFSLVMAAILCLGMNTIAFASSNSIDGQGAIGNPSGGSNDIVLTVPSYFYWYADATTETSAGSGVFNIQSGSYNIVNNSQAPNLKVKLDGYALTSGGNDFTAATKTGITLNLTGDLADGTVTTLGQNLYNSAAAFGTYTNVLYGTSYVTANPSATNTWSFGFGGNYTGTLPATGELADYTLALTFSVDSLS